MTDSLLSGRGRDLIQIPRAEWDEQQALVPAHQAQRLRFMTPDHHRLRDFAVRELTRAGRPIAPFEIAQALNLPIARVTDGHA